MTSRSVQPGPDPRWVNFIGGFDDHGQPRPMTYLALVTLTDQWSITESTPGGVAGLLGTTRATFALAWFHYELLVVSVTWSLLAVEAALRDRLAVDEKPPLKSLLNLAAERVLLSSQDIDRLDAGRELRNHLAHAKDQQAWTVGMAAPVVGASHHAVTLLYPDSI